MPVYIRTIDPGSSNVYIEPIGTKRATQLVPAGGLTPTGKWVPLNATESGTLLTESDQTIASMPYFDDVVEDVTPGVAQTLLDVTVPDGVTRSLNQVFVVTRVTGTYVITANGVTIGSGRTGPGCDPRFSFDPPRPLAAGVEYQVVFQSRLNAPVQSVECFVQASDMNA